MPPRAPAVPATIPQRYEPAVPLDRLVLHPANPNSGDLGAISASLDTLGFYGAVLAQESTGIICAGNHRLKAALAAGMPTLPVVWLDVDDDARDRILIMDNQATRLGMWDEPALVTFLQGLAITPQGFSGTGFDGDDLDVMIRHLEALGERPTDPSAEWDGMPDFDQPDAQSKYNVIVHFPTEEDQARFFEILGHPPAKWLWWPHDDGHRGSDFSQMEITS